MTTGIYKTDEEQAAIIAAAEAKRVRPAIFSSFGVPVLDQHTTEDAIVAAGLDWEVEQTPDQQLLRDGTFRPVPGAFHVVRKDTELVLGHVRTRYATFQNREAFSFFDPILDSGLATLDAANELYGGKVVWLAAKFNEPVIVAGREDEQVDMYALLRTSHDGSSSVSVDITPIRIRCNNALNLALSKTVQSWKVSHTGNLQTRLTEAREVIENLGIYTTSFKATAEQLLSVEMDLAEFETFALELTRGAEALTEKLVEHHSSTPTLSEDVRATAWGALNSVGEYLQYERNFRSEDRAFKQNMFGTTKGLRDRAVRLLTR